MPTLHILSPSSLARTIDLTKKLMAIGRTEDNEIHIPDHNVSKRHGILVRDGDDYQLHDFNSTNGTFVNNERIMAVKLKHGVSIRLGAVELRYESEPAKPGLSPDSAALLGAKQGEGILRASGGGSPRTSAKERGMAKVVKPDFAGGKLQTGPVTLKPGFSAKPIPPAPSKTPES
ncbi:MAG TPA: FHA domain-containing protein [Verrucomicrobiae bacterium]|nr:FHA domain-containing protein [Verrucomicrobiae bacterium]